MNKIIAILLIGKLLAALPVLAAMRSDSYRLTNTLSSDNCSVEIENLKLCVENPKVVVNSGEQVQIKLFWINVSGSDRRVGRRSNEYNVTVTDKNGKKLVPFYLQRYLERQKKMRESGEEDKGILLRAFGGSDRGLNVQANGIEKDAILLTGKMYDYDLAPKGTYYVTVSRNVESLEKGKNIEFVLDDIEIQVK